MGPRKVFTILLISFIGVSFAYQNNVPGVIDGKVTPVVSNVPNSGYDTSFVAQWELTIGDSVNIDQVVLEIRELQGNVLHFSDSVDFDSLNGTGGPFPYRDGLDVFLERGSLQAGKRYRFKAELLGVNGNSSPKSFNKVR